RSNRTWIVCRPCGVTALQRFSLGRVAEPAKCSTILKERRDVDLVVADLQRGALVLVHRDVAVAPGPPGRLPRRARPRVAMVEPGRDHRYPHLVAHPVVD